MKARQKGFTAIEIMITMFIAFLASLFVMNAMQNEFVEKEGENAYQKIEMLHSVVTRYYDTHCPDGGFIQPTLAILSVEGLLSSTEKVEVADTNGPNINILNVGTGQVVFEYSLEFPNSIIAEKYVVQSRNASRVGALVMWRFSNHAVKNDAVVDAFQYLEAFGSTVCG